MLFILSSNKTMTSPKDNVRKVTIHLLVTDRRVAGDPVSCRHVPLFCSVPDLDIINMNKYVKMFTQGASLASKCCAVSFRPMGAELSTELTVEDFLRKFKVGTCIS